MVNARREDVTSVSSPYFLHPNENCSLVLVNPVLTEQNYHTWSRAMRVALKSKNKLSFVDGSRPQPLSDDPLFEAWERCNNMVMSWITKAVSPSIAQSILWFDDASAAWSDLRERFAKDDSVRISDLQEDKKYVSKVNQVQCYKEEESEEVEELNQVPEVKQQQSDFSLTREQYEQLMSNMNQLMAMIPQATPSKSAHLSTVAGIQSYQIDEEIAANAIVTEGNWIEDDWVS